MRQNRIAQLLDERQIKPAQFARQAGLPPMTVYNIIKKEAISKIEVSTFIKIADGLNMSVEELYYGVKPTRTYIDPRQQRLNDAYDTFNDEGKEQIADVADTMAVSGKFLEEGGSAGLAQEAV